jgi:hypothetical protein
VSRLRSNSPENLESSGEDTRALAERLVAATDTGDGMEPNASWDPWGFRAASTPPGYNPVIEGSRYESPFGRRFRIRFDANTGVWHWTGDGWAGEGRVADADPKVYGSEDEALRDIPAALQYITKWKPGWEIRGWDVKTASLLKNPGALQGPAMRTRFGTDVDPERVETEDLDAAFERYDVFHDKDPRRAVRLAHDLPTKLVPVGKLKSVMYRTDKWKKDGDDEDYKHVDDPGVILYEPYSSYGKSKVERDGPPGDRPEPCGPPVAYPKALTLLGYCLGFFVERFDDGETYECNPRGAYLFCSPSGDMLALYSPEAQPGGHKGFLCVMAGGRLRVEKDGIDG